MLVAVLMLAPSSPGPSPALLLLPPPPGSAPGCDRAVPASPSTNLAAEDEDEDMDDAPVGPGGGAGNCSVAMLCSARRHALPSPCSPLRQRPRRGRGPHLFPIEDRRGESGRVVPRETTSGHVGYARRDDPRPGGDAIRALPAALQDDSVGQHRPRPIDASHAPASNGVACWLLGLTWSAGERRDDLIRCRGRGEGAAELPPATHRALAGLNPRVNEPLWMGVVEARR